MNHEAILKLITWKNEIWKENISFSLEKYLRLEAYLLLGKTKRMSERKENHFPQGLFFCQDFAIYHLCVSGNLLELLR